MCVVVVVETSSKEKSPRSAIVLYVSDWDNVLAWEEWREGGGTAVAVGVVVGRREEGRRGGIYRGRERERERALQWKRKRH